jgi:hypothetical protein
MSDSLCETCWHVREVRTPRSRFLLCELSRTNPEFTKYPRQPVVRCPGYRPRAQGGAPGVGDPAGGRA